MTVGPASRERLKQHRATLILVLGVLSLVVCGLLGPVAWVLASRDLEEMAVGAMDPSGRALTSTGRVLGMIATFATLLVQLLILVVVGLAAIWYFIYAR